MKRILVFIGIICSIHLNAQTGIGTTTPDASAKLDVSATNKGFLPPRVTLTGKNDNSTISSPAIGLLVYNTGSNSNLLAGYYYWNGSAWSTIATSVGSEPIGTVLSFAGSTAPLGYLICDGSAISRTTYVSLFNIIGTNYGTGDGSTTFNLPDLRSKTVVGVGQGTGLTNRTLASSGGVESKTLTTNELPSHNHTATSSVSDPSHRHWISSADIDDRNFSGTGANGQNYGIVADAGSYSQNDPGYGTGRFTGYSSTGISVSTSIGNSGNGGSFAIMNPFLSLNYIIKY